MRYNLNNGFCIDIENYITNITTDILQIIPCYWWSIIQSWFYPKYAL